MAAYGRAGLGIRIFLMLLVVVALVLGGLLWFDYLGVVDAKDRLAPVFGLFGLRRRATIESVEDPLLLEYERLEQQREAIKYREEELAKAEELFAQKESELNQLILEVQEREGSLEDREKTFNEKLKAYENRRGNLIQESQLLTGMPPANAVEILLERDDQDVIDVFRITEEIALQTGEVSLVSYWISLMPAERGAEIMRKMTRK